MQAPTGSIEPARIRTTPAPVAARGRYPNEERFVRDLYARLMRYDLAAREFHAIESGATIAPGSYLAITLRDLRTQAWTGSGNPGVSPDGADVLTIQRQALCNGDDPCHAYYDVFWTQASAARSAHQPPSTGDVSRYTRYTVTLTLAGVSRTYQAVILYHVASDGTATPEVIDPVIPDLDALAGDRAPLARAPWAAYTKTRHYAAVAQKARDWHANPSSRALSVPIGFIVGDDVSRDDEMTVAMTAGSCTAPEQIPTFFVVVGTPRYTQGPPAPYVYNINRQILDQNRQPINMSLLVKEIYSPAVPDGDCTNQPVQTSDNYSNDAGIFGPDLYSMPGTAPNPCTSTSVQRFTVRLNGADWGIQTRYKVTWQYSGVEVTCIEGCPPPG